MTASKRHSINGAKVRARDRGPWRYCCGFWCVPLSLCWCEVQVWEGGGCEAHHQGQKVRRIGTED